VLPARSRMRLYQDQPVAGSERSDAVDALDRAVARIFG
jgi:hypothetical protein